MRLIKGVKDAKKDMPREYDMLRKIGKTLEENGYELTMRRTRTRLYRGASKKLWKKTVGLSLESGTGPEKRTLVEISSDSKGSIYYSVPGSLDPVVWEVYRNASREYRLKPYTDSKSMMTVERQKYGN